MIDVKIERTDVNLELLDAQLRTVGGESFHGLSADRVGVTLHLSDATPANLQKALERIVRQHDATQMTPQQEARAARQTQIEQGRTHAPLDKTRYTDSPALIQALAEKIAWLEQEMRDLRGVS